MLASGFTRVDGITYDNSPTPQLFAVITETSGNHLKNSVAQIDPVSGIVMKKLTIGLDLGLDGITIDPSPGGYL